VTAPRVVVLGATSAIAEATARLYAAEGAHILLAGRRGDRLEAIAADLTARGAAACHTRALDLADPGDVMARLGEMAEALGGVDYVLLAYGVLGEQGAAEQDPARARSIIQVNFSSAAEWALAAAALLERQRRGTLVALSSVAGDRGRKTNYVYGAAKGGLTVLMQGIAHRLAACGARAVVLKAGFVDTPMTDAFDKRGPLWAKPEQIARIARRAADRGGPVVYAPAFWYWIMLVLRLLPSAIFHRLSI